MDQSFNQPLGSHITNVYTSDVFNGTTQVSKQAFGLDNDAEFQDLYQNSGQIDLEFDQSAQCNQ
jgi:hypothetical protein